MGKHSFPGPPPPDGPDDPDPLQPYLQRRRPPLGGPRIYRALHGGASHVDPDAPRALLAWDGFAYRPVGTAPDLPAARAWVAEAAPPEDDTRQGVWGAT